MRQHLERQQQLQLGCGSAANRTSHPSCSSRHATQPTQYKAVRPAQPAHRLGTSSSASAVAARQFGRCSSSFCTAALLLVVLPLMVATVSAAHQPAPALAAAAEAAPKPAAAAAAVVWEPSQPDKPEARVLAAALTEPVSTPWGPAGAVILCLLPIVFLLLVTVVKALLLPTSISLPAAAAMLAFIRLAYLSSPAVLVAACCVGGLLDALTPLSIITGAIMLFQSMHHTKCLPWMMGQIKSLSAGHPVAEVFLIGYAFAYLVEGASGFGTPVALAAPMLASLGHAPIPTVVCLLIMNTLATQFGAVGTPIWFGFGELNIGEDNLQLVGLKASIIVGACAFIIAPMAASFLVPMRELLRSGLFVVLSIATAVAPALLISMFSYEFPTLIGGLGSVLLTGLLVKYKVGLRPVDPKFAAAQAAAAAAAVVGGDSSTRSSYRVAAAASFKSRGGSTIYTPSARSGMSASFSFVDDVGAVSHPPVATLDFPITNAPSSYPRATRHNFAAQADEETILHELAALKHHTAADALEDEQAAAAAAAGSSDGANQPDAPATYNKDLEAGGVIGGGVASAKAADRTDRQPTKTLPMRSSPSGHMELNPLDPEVALKPRLTVSDLLLRTLPLWMTVLVLLLTRIPAIPIKRVLQSTVPSFYWHLGTFGTFGISASLVVQLRAILSEPRVNWKYEALYVPFLLPFAAASLITVAVHRRDLEVRWTVPFKEAFQRVAGITVATLGALVLVQLIRVGGPSSPAYIIGFYFSSWLSHGFLAISAFLGALGSFFSGSTTVSNLTFGDIQSIAAATIGSPVTAMLAVQVAGATIGNMICINNILSAKAVMNMNHVSEGEFIRRTAPVALLFALLAQAIGLIFTVGHALPDKPIGVTN